MVIRELADRTSLLLNHVVRMLINSLALLFIPLQPVYDYMLLLKPQISESDDLYVNISNQCLPSIMMFVVTVAKIMDLYLEPSYELLGGKTAVKVFNAKLSIYPLFFDRNYNSSSTIMGMKYLQADFLKVLKHWSNNTSVKGLGSGNLRGFKELIEVVYFKILSTCKED